MRVTLVSEGVTWEGWKSLTIQQTLDKAQHSFSMTTTDRFQEGLDRWNISGGSSVDVYFDTSLAFSGYVQKYSPSLTATEHAISISGESKAIDAVQGSHDGSYFWRDVSAESIIEEVLEPMGFEATIDKPLEAIGPEGFRAAVNSSPFDIVKRLAERNGLLVFTDNEGNFRLSDSSNQVTFTEIGRGDYIEISAEHDVSKSYSEIIVKGQRNTFSVGFQDQQRMEHRVQNSSQTRHRPLVVITTGQEVEQDKLAQYIHRRLAGDSVTASVVLKTPYDKDGNLWGVGQRIWLNEPIVDIDQELIISSVDFTLDESSGFKTTLGLKVPETYTIDPAQARAARRSTGIFGNILKAFL